MRLGFFHLIEEIEDATEIGPFVYQLVLIVTTIAHYLQNSGGMAMMAYCHNEILHLMTLTNVSIPPRTRI